MSKTLIIFLICIMIVVKLGAEIKDEISGYGFLNIENSARIFGMGGAGVSLPAGISSIRYNPASLSFIRKFEFASSYRMLYADLKYESLNAGMKFNQWNVGIGLDHLHLPDFSLFSYGLETSEKLNFRNIGVNLFLSRYVFKKTSAGISLKYINYLLADDTSSAFCADIGILSKLSKSFNAGISVLNLGTASQFKNANSKDKLPTKMLAGFSYQLKNYLLFSQQFGLEFPSYYIINTGIEFLPDFFIRPRAGIIFNKNEIDYTGGAGINFNLKSFNFGINYALNPFSKLGMNHLFELKISKLIERIIEEPEDKKKTVSKMTKKDYGQYDNAGNVLFREGMYKEAIIIWEKIPEDYKYYDKVQKYINLAKQRLLKMGSVPEKDKKVLELTEKDCELYYYAGVLLYKEEMYNEADEVWAKIPEHLMYYKKIQEFIKQSKSESIEVESKPDEDENAIKAETHLRNADMYLKLNDYESAKKELESVIQLTPNNKFAYYKLGKIYYEQGDYRSALKNIRKSLYIDENFEEAIKVEKLIISKVEKDKPIWLKEDTFYAKKKLVYENFEDEGIIQKFVPESGTFEKIITKDNNYGKWDLKFEEKDMVLYTSIRLPDLSKFIGIIISLSSKDISKISIVLIEQSLNAIREWEVIVPGIKNEFQEMKIPFRYFYLEGQSDVKIDLKKVSKIKFVVKKEFLSGKTKKIWVGIDNLKFYK